MIGGEPPLREEELRSNEGKNEIALNPEGNKEELSRKYLNSLRSYHRLEKVIRGLLTAPQPWNEQHRVKMEARNIEKHDKHLKLTELGKKIGKDENNVLVDIVREGRTLENYDLPEFSIMTENDILQTGMDNVPFLFNVESVESDKGAVMLAGENIDEGRKKSIRRSLFAARRMDSLIPHDHFFLAFAIVPTRGNRKFILDDYDARFTRAKSLAFQLRGKFYDLMDEGWHANQTVAVLGVLFPNKDFNRVVTEIRNNPDQFRLGEQFYNENELYELERRKKLREPRKK